MSPPFLLDTSALLAHYCRQGGHEIIGQILQEHPDQAFTSVIAWLEFEVRLKDLTPDSSERSEVLDIYQQLLTECLPATLPTAKLAFEIWEATQKDLPNSLALIAATARIKGATLLHRDPRFLSIPASMLSQVELPA